MLSELHLVLNTARITPCTEYCQNYTDLAQNPARITPHTYRILPALHLVPNISRITLTLHRNLPELHLVQITASITPYREWAITPPQTEYHQNYTKNIKLSELHLIQNTGGLRCLPWNILVSVYPDPPLYLHIIQNIAKLHLVHDTARTTPCT